MSADSRRIQLEPLATVPLNKQCLFRSEVYASVGSFYSSGLSLWTGRLSPISPHLIHGNHHFALPSCSLSRTCTLPLFCQMWADLASHASWGWGVSNCLSGPLKLLSLVLRNKTLPFSTATLGREKGNMTTLQTASEESV